MPKLPLANKNVPNLHVMKSMQSLMSNDLWRFRLPPCATVVLRLAGLSPKVQ
ncbi:hypothetical protein U0070_003708, partial [Myodes glareolus]